MVVPSRLPQLLLKTRQLPTVTQELPISSPSLLDPQPELLLDSVADTLVLLLRLDLLVLDSVEPEPGLDMGLELALESVLEVLVLAMVLVMELEVLEVLVLVLALVLFMELEVLEVLALVLVMEPEVLVLAMYLGVLVLALVLVMELELEAWWLSPTEQLSLLRSQLLLPHDLNTLLPLLPARVD